MKTFDFTITIRGTGETEEDAWWDAVEAFDADPGHPHETRRVWDYVPEDEEFESDEP